MKTRHVVGALAAIALLLVVPGLVTAIQVEPVVSTGLSSPVFVSHAGDGSNPLFIVQRGGTIRVLQPGTSG